MVGITSYGAYVPMFRLSFGAIGAGAEANTLAVALHRAGLPVTRTLRMRSRPSRRTVVCP